MPALLNALVAPCDQRAVSPHQKTPATSDEFSWSAPVIGLQPAAASHLQHLSVIGATVTWRIPSASAALQVPRHHVGKIASPCWFRLEAGIGVYSPDQGGGQ